MTKTITKADILKAVQELPENATVEDAIEHLVLLHKVETGLRQARAGQSIPQAEVEAHFKKRREQRR